MQELSQSAYDLLKKKSGSSTASSTVSDDSLDPKAYMMLKAQEEPSAPQAEPKSIGGFLKNIPSSAGNALGSMLQLIPGSGMYTNMAKVASGGMAKAVGDRFPMPDAMQAEVPAFDAAVEAGKQRYGHPLDTMYNDPVGSMIDIASLATGAGGLARGTAGAASRLGMELPRVARAGEIAGEVGRAVNPLTYAGAAAKGAGKAVGKGVTGILGLTTGQRGAGRDLMRTIGVTGKDALLEGGKPIPGHLPVSTNAMRGAITAEDTVKNLRYAMQTARDKRLAEFMGRVDLTGPASAELANAKVKFDEALARHGVVPRQSSSVDDILARQPAMPSAARGTPGYLAQDAEFSRWRSELDAAANAGGEGRSRLDFSNSAILPTDEAATTIGKIDALFTKFENNPNLTAKQLHDFKVALDDMYSPSKRSRDIVQATKDAVRKELNQSVPGYKERSSAWHDATNKIEAFEKEFGNDQANPGTVIRKTATMLSQNNDYRRHMVESLNAVQPGMGDRLIAEIAGQHFSSTMPRGLVGNVSAVGALGTGARALATGHLKDVATLAMLPATLPRVVGEGLSAVKRSGLGGLGNKAVDLSTNPLLATANRTMAGDVGYTPTYSVDANPANATPPEVPLDQVPVEVKRQMPDGTIHVFDSKTGAYLRTEK
jgi:hypothetical protein